MNTTATSTATNAAPAISAPAPNLLAQLEQHIQENALDGPAFCWDEANQVFLTVVARAGVIVAWQIAPAATRPHADALRNGTLQSVTMAALLLAAVVPPPMRDALEKHFASAINRPLSH